MTAEASYIPQPPLAGLRVLELAQGIAGPFCGKLLAEFGAEVIKLEPPRGDSARQRGPFASDRPDAEGSLLLLYLNTAKRSISVNLESRVALRLLAALAQQTDVLITDLSLGAMEALPRGRRLVYTSIRPFGLDGPHAEWVWTEITVEALAGVMAVVGDPDRPPLKVGGAQAQYLGGLNAAVGTLLALEDRDRTGLGQVVDISMQESVLTILGNIPLLYSHLASWPGAAERRGDRELQRAGDTQLPSGLCQAARAESAADHGIDAQPRHGRTLQRLRGLR